MIAPKKNRIEPRDYDWNLCADRYPPPSTVMERLFNRLKHYHWLATRCDKLGRNYLSFVPLAAAMKLLINVAAIQGCAG